MTTFPTYKSVSSNVKSNPFSKGTVKKSLPYKCRIYFTFKNKRTNSAKKKKKRKRTNAQRWANFNKVGIMNTQVTF